MAATKPSTTFVVTPITAKGILPKAQSPSESTAPLNLPKVGTIIGRGTSATNKWFKKSLNEKSKNKSKKSKGQFNIIDSVKIDNLTYKLVETPNNKYFVEISKNLGIMNNKKSRSKFMNRKDALFSFKQLKSKQKIIF